MNEEVNAQRQINIDKGYNQAYGQEEKELRQWYEEEENRVINRDGVKAWLDFTGRDK